MKYFVFIVCCFFLFCLSGCIDSALNKWQGLFEILFLLAAFIFAGDKFLKLKS